MIHYWWGKPMGSKGPAIWVLGAIITMVVWTIVLLFIFNFTPTDSHNHFILVLVTSIILGICLGLVFYYYIRDRKRILATQNKLDF